MCGIVFVSKESKAVAQATWKRYKAQDTRGKEGFGYVAISGTKLADYKRSSLEDNIKEALMKETANTILFHHRYPTSTANFKETAHPIRVENAELDSVYYVVHNGIISNDTKLKAEHEKRGYKYTTAVRKEWITSEQTYFSEEFNDSECIAIELARLIDGKSDKVQALGSYAFIVAQEKNGVINKIYYGTNGGNPLKVKDNKGFYSITSEGEGRSVESGTLYSFDLRKRIVNELKADIGKIEYKAQMGLTSQYDSKALGLYDDDYTIGSQLEELEWDKQALEERMEYAKQAARLTGDYSEVAELKMEIQDIEQEHEQLELEAGLKIT